EPPYYSFWCDATALGATLAAPDAVTVARAHGGDLYVERDPPYFLPLRNETLTRLTRTFCISEHGLRYAQARYPAAAPRLALHRLGVPPAPQRTAVSTDGVLRIVSCAFMLPLKRLDLLAEAVRLVRAPLQWTHLGDGPARVAVENRLASLPPHVDVRLMGHLPGPEVRRFYEAQPVDVFISVSRSEGLPVSMMEAMSFGIPVLGTDVGGVRELVGEATLLPPDPTPAEVAARLDALAALPREQMAEMRQQAWARWQGTVDARVQYPAFIEALNTLAR
ncbi:MAG TPA: glycosyltransferase, partial [Myxococcota bacterium]|nr:glycosyltransferase [Myxococcota bacterium]